jgi:hypothetical protein
VIVTEPSQHRSCHHAEDQVRCDASDHRPQLAAAQEEAMGMTVGW